MLRHFPTLTTTFIVTWVQHFVVWKAFLPWTLVMPSEREEKRSSAFAPREMTAPTGPDATLSVCLFLQAALREPDIEGREELHRLHSCCGNVAVLSLGPSKPWAAILKPGA